MVLAMWLLWAALSSVLFGLMIYRGIITMHEGDPLVLNEVRARSHTHAVHKVVIRKLFRSQPILGVFASATTVMSVLLTSIYVYHAVEVIHARMR
jgi:hypothetical protein